VTALEIALRQICVHLTDAHAAFAVVGGLAVSARTEPRFTRDVDIAVARASDAEAEELVRALQSDGYTIAALVEQDAVGRLATARLTRSGDAMNPVVDLLFASSGIEGEVVAEADTIELLPQLRVPVAATAHLIALKVLARDDVTRPQDVGDLRALIRAASPGDISRARQALGLIAQRGYHRGRDLESEFEALLRTQRE
jgi:predicted nucleotidyltransferase